MKTERMVTAGASKRVVSRLWSQREAALFAASSLLLLAGVLAWIFDAGGVATGGASRAST